MEESDVDYHIDEDLEEIFHSDLQNIELGHGDRSQDDIIGDHLPEWLVGVIVVIAMLIVAFFVMIITSLIKNRNKSRSSTYIGTGSSTACDDLESGKIGHSDESGMKITSFTSVPDTGNDRSMSAADSSDHDHLTSRDAGDVIGVQGCKNPLFVDDELESDENNEDKENKENKENKNTTTKTGSTSNGINMPSTSNDINMPSTSNGISASDPTEQGRTKCVQHKYKQGGNGKKNSIKSESHENDKSSESDNDARKRMFASKSKCGSQISNKKDKGKGLSSSDVTSSDGEARKSPDDAKAAGKENNMEDQKTNSSRDVDVKDKDTSGCCEDSGIDLGSTDSHVKDEAGGSSESDDIVSMVTRASYEVCRKGNSGQSADAVRSDGNKYLNVSPSLTLHSEGDSPSSCDTEKSGLYPTPGSQSSSLDCSLENLTLTVLGTPGDKADVDLRLLGSVSGSVEALELPATVQDKLLTSGTATRKEAHLQPVLETAGCPVEEGAATSCDSSSSNIKRTSDSVTPRLSEKSVADIAVSAGDSRPRNYLNGSPDKMFNTSEYENNIDPDKLLSTNL